MCAIQIVPNAVKEKQLKTSDMESNTKVKVMSQYSHFMVSNPHCALHTAIRILEQWSLTRAILHQNTHKNPPFQYCNHVSDCSMHCAIGTRICEMTDYIIMRCDYTLSTMFTYKKQAAGGYNESAAVRSSN